MRTCFRVISATPNIPVRAGLLILALISLSALLTGRAGAAEPLSITPTSFDFGAKNVGGEATQPGEFVVTNDSGSAVVLGRADATPPDPFIFRILPNFDLCSFETLQPGESCGIVVVFEPTLAGEFTGKLEINSAALGAPVTAALAGVGFPELLPDVEITPERLEFGRHGIGTTSDPRKVSVKNTGEGDMELGTAQISDANADEFEIFRDRCAGIIMASGSTCQLDVTFTPGAAGIRNASLFVPTDVAGADTRVPLSGTGVGIVPDPDPEDPGTAKVRIGGKLPKVKGRKLTIPITCVVARMDLCDGAIVVRAGGNRIAGAPYSARPGRASISTKLNRPAVRILNRRGHLRAGLILRVKQGQGGFASHKVNRTLRR